MTTAKLLTVGLVGFAVGVAPDLANVDPITTVGGAGLGLGATLVWTLFGLARKADRALDAAVNYFEGVLEHRKSERVHWTRVEGLLAQNKE